MTGALSVLVIVVSRISRSSAADQCSNLVSLGPVGKPAPDYEIAIDEATGTRMLAAEIRSDQQLAGGRWMRLLGADLLLME